METKTSFILLLVVCFVCILNALPNRNEREEKTNFLSTRSSLKNECKCINWRLCDGEINSE